ncbi:HNH endonuclease [Pullulanibacillus sp. KACC 23026]|uniref:HNH endonuclease n=1 Tax=Pullulanibacillus sp. KACC 23026 TaxID=3028315 RepID=UPI0023B19288|nr:HNH endonuclease [Pullulanibacillus sp. KACC 23026]WEG14915.1 HNH endonuclease [Pullulanibacillus sp. KACC 23026]
MCLKDGRLEPSRHTDHIKPVSGPNDPLFWDPNNHQALCVSCHSTKTAKEDGGFGRRKKR